MINKTISIYCGMLVRGIVKKSILDMCALRDISVSVNEIYGLLGSTYYFSMTGVLSDVSTVQKYMENLVANNTAGVKDGYL